MKVSIVTATYNSAEYIEDTYSSIAAQTFSDWEWIITDDASSDNTCEIIRRFSSHDSRVKLLVQSSNQGAARARNASLQAASGDFIAFIDSDDLWDPFKLEKQLAFMASNIDFCFTSYALVSANGRRLGKFVDTDAAASLGYHDLLKKVATVGCSTVMLRRNAFPRILMPDLRTGQDYALWLHLLRSTTSRAYLLNETLSSYRIRPGSISRNKFKKALRQWEIYRDLESLSFFYAFYCFVHYAIKAVLR